MLSTLNRHTHLTSKISNGFELNEGLRSKILLQTAIHQNDVIGRKNTIQQAHNVIKVPDINL